MKLSNHLKKVVLLAVFTGVAVPAHGGSAGYLEYTATHNDNYILAHSSDDKLSETLQTLSVSLVHFRPYTEKTSLVTGGALSYTQYARFEDLSAAALFLSGGVHHRWSKRYSFTGMAGAYLLSRENEFQDQDGYAIHLTFLQKITPTLWLKEQLFYEMGAARNLSDDFKSYGVNTSLSRMLRDQSVLAATFAVSKKIYHDPLNRDLTGIQLRLDWTYPFLKQYYCRVGIAKTAAGADNNYGHQSVMSQVAIGYKFK